MSISEQINDKISILDLAAEYVQLKKAWANYKALSPFKSEKTPSFIVSPAKNIAYCFGTHKWWPPIKFLSEIENIPYWEALQILAKRAWVPLKTNFYKESWDKRWFFFTVHKIATKFYQERLLAVENIEALDYIKSRWLSLETIKNFRLGFQDNSRWLFKKLIDSWISEKDIIDSWVFIAVNRDKFINRIIFPIANYRWDIVWFTWRALNDKQQPKYLNSPATEIFNKSEILFGIDLARFEITKKDSVIIVEWQMDVCSLHQAWYINTIALSWTALTDYQVKILKRLTNKIYLCLDNDSAWIKATFSSIDSLLNKDIDIRIILLWKHNDPDELLKSWDDFQEYFDKARTHINFYLERASFKHDVDSVIWKKEIIKELLEYLVNIRSNIEVDAYLREISSFLNISLDVLYEEYKKTWFKLKRESKKELKKSRDSKIIRYSLAEQIAWNITYYDFWEEFWENFRLDLDDIRTYLENWLVLSDLLENWEITDNIKTCHIFLEEINIGKDSNKIKLDFLTTLGTLHSTIYKKKIRDLKNQIKKEPSNISLLKQLQELTALNV